MEALWGGGTLNCLFGAALLIGFLYALFLIFFQGVGHAFEIGDINVFGIHIELDGIPGHDVHPHLGGHGGSEVPGLSMLAISGFITAFGAFGMVSATFLRAAVLVSLLIAAAGGLLVGAAAQVFFVRVISTTTSSNVDLSTIKGTSAQVIIPIPATGLGQIALVMRGQRVTLGARASAAQAIGRGAHVIVDSLRDGVAFVSLVPDD
jgi:hypothetical protein